MNDNIPNVCLAKGDHHLRKKTISSTQMIESCSWNVQKIKTSWCTIAFLSPKMRKQMWTPQWQRPTPWKIGMSPKPQVAKLGRIVGLQPFTGRVGRRRKRRWRSVASTPSIHPPSSTCPNLLSTPFFFKCVTIFIFFYRWIISTGYSAERLTSAR